MQDHATRTSHEDHLRHVSQFFRDNPPHRHQQKGHRQSNANNPNNRQTSNPWTSTPRDPSNRSQINQQSFGDSMTNASLLNILDTQCQVQQETTHALSTIIKLQDT